MKALVLLVLLASPIPPGIVLVVMLWAKVVRSRQEPRPGYFLGRSG